MKIYTLFCKFLNVGKTKHNYPSSIIFWINYSKVKLVCLRSYTIHTQQTSTSSTAGFEFVNVCWGELPNSSLNHFMQKLIAITCKDQMWRWVEYLFESRVKDGDLILGRPCIYGFSTKVEVLILFCYHDGMTTICFLNSILLRKTLLFLISDCEYQFHLLAGLC